MESPSKPAQIVPGVFDVLSALLCERSGFHTMFLSGAALHAAVLGRQDIGLLTATELADTASRIRDRIDCTLIVDADTGFGGTHNLRRTVKLLERAGAAIVQIEDQLAIKPPGQLLQRPVASAAEMVDRIHAALDSRGSPSTLVSARTDALTSLGFDEALERAALYAEAGADLLFVQSLSSRAEADRVAAAALGRPLIIHLPDRHESSDLDLVRLGEQGFAYELLPSMLINASAQALASSLASLGGAKAVSDLGQCLSS
jgi:2-methylisocitrate lyase-like PEP mutase family enzyme